VGEETFWDVSLALGLDSLSDGRGFVAFDFDHDGDADIAVANSSAPAQLFVNRWADRLDNHWLKVRLEGNGEQLPQGATVRVHAGGRVEARSYSLGPAYASSHAGPLLFGLGSAATVDRVEVTWPGGARSVVESPPVDQLLTLTHPGMAP
jgi:hypothetical protein